MGEDGLLRPLPAALTVAWGRPGDAGACAELLNHYHGSPDAASSAVLVRHCLAPALQLAHLRDLDGNRHLRVAPSSEISGDQALWAPGRRTARTLPLPPPPQ